MEVFKDYAYYYNAFYQDKDYCAETMQINTLLKKYGKNVREIINYGCGTGRHDIELSKLGYHCTGIDISSNMIDIAIDNGRRESQNINFMVSDIREFVSEKRYDAVVSLFHVMSYQNRNQDILAAFRSAREVLDKGGLFLFDVWYGPGVLTDKPMVRVKEIEDERYKMIRVAKPVMNDKESTVSVSYEVFIIEKETGRTKVISEVHNMRYFFRPELDFLLREAGFILVDNLDCKTLGETDFNSWTSYFIAEAI